MELRLLGPVELWSDNKRIPAGPAKQRCVLAVLALSAGAPVAAETLIDRVWGEHQPKNVRGALYTYVALLRRLLAGRAPRKNLLRRDPEGYVLGIDADQVDVHRFRGLIAQARRSQTSRERLKLLTEALGLWREIPLSGIPGDWANSVRTNLKQLHLNALIEQIDLTLDVGGPSPELVDKLADLVAEHPSEERLAGQMMLALYRSGRAAEALAVFERTRQHLADQYGNDPGADLRQLHQGILRQDLAMRPRSGAVIDTRPEVPRQLPMAPRTFVGRDNPLDTINRALAAQARHTPPIVAIYGPGGIGKSALALRAAHGVSQLYPDGQLYVDLQGSSPGMSPLSPLEALSRLLRTLGLSAAAVPDDAQEAAAKFRSLLADRRILLLLDNAEGTSQVRLLLPAHANASVLITSRSMLTSLDDARHVALAILRPSESAALLTQLDTSGRIAQNLKLGEQLAELCDHLPLALRITAARMTSRPDWPLRTFVERLTDEQQRLDHLDQRDRSVRACFQASYQALARGEPADRRAAHAFRLLGLPDGPDISLPITARLLDLPEPQSEAVLDRLVDAQLLKSPVPGRYQMHDLIRLYAREIAEGELTQPDRYTALSRVWGCYVATAALAAQLLRPGRRKDLVAIDSDQLIPLGDHRAAASWLDTESPNLLAAARQSAVAPNDLSRAAVQLAHVLFGFMSSNSYWRDLHDLNLRALDVVRVRNDRSGEAQILSDLGVMVWRTGDGNKAVKLFIDSVRTRREVGDRIGEATSLYNLGTAYAARGDHARALNSLAKALRTCREAGYLSGEAIAHATLGDIHLQLGNFNASTQHSQSALHIYRELHDASGEAEVLRTLGLALLERHQFDDAIRRFQEALSVNRERGDEFEAALVLVHLGQAHRLKGDLARAAEVCEEALAISEQIGAQKERALALWWLGEALVDLGKIDRARSHWREALPIFDRLGVHEAVELRRRLGANTLRDIPQHADEGALAAAFPGAPGGAASFEPNTQR